MEAVEDRGTGYMCHIFKKKCDCICHDPNRVVMHIMPCCDNDRINPVVIYMKDQPHREIKAWQVPRLIQSNKWKLSDPEIMEQVKAAGVDINLYLL